MGRTLNNELHLTTSTYGYSQGFVWVDCTQLNASENTSLYLSSITGRSVIPKKLRSKLLAQLHVNHPGMSKVKAVARGYFWWPGLDGDIERLAKKCLACQSVKQAPPVSTHHPWVWPTRPWQRIHFRLCGPGLFKALCFLCW